MYTQVILLYLITLFKFCCVYTSHSSILYYPFQVLLCIHKAFFYTLLSFSSFAVYTQVILLYLITLFKFCCVYTSHSSILYYPFQVLLCIHKSFFYTLLSFSSFAVYTQGILLYFIILFKFCCVYTSHSSILYYPFQALVCTHNSFFFTFLSFSSIDVYTQVFLLYFIVLFKRWCVYTTHSSILYCPFQILLCIGVHNSFSYTLLSFSSVAVYTQLILLCTASLA